MQPRLAVEADRERWNQFMADWPNGDLLQAFEWGELKARSGWEPIRLMLEDGSKIRAAISILKKAFRFRESASSTHHADPLWILMIEKHCRC